MPRIDLSAAAPGRGAPANRTPTRFNLKAREADGDWLDERGCVDGEVPPLRTSVTVEKPRTIISTNTSPDIPFDHSINPYRGCEHGCVYCYARPTHAFHDLSPGLDFESKLFAKPDAAALLRAELGKKGYKATAIALGTNTDPYQPIEGQWRITRQILELLAETDHAVTIITKSDRVVRDIDILAPMAAKGIVAVAISVTSLDAAIHRTLEPRAPRPAKRLAAIRTLAAAGIPMHVNVAPIIPGITDHEIEAILEAARDAGVKTASFIPIRLPHEVAPLFRDWLEVHYRERAGKIITLIRSIRQERDNDPDFFSRMRGSGPWAEMIRTRFRIACKRFGLNQVRIALDETAFRPPEGGQLRLF
jgi:DNA repair photolyase